MEPNNQADKTIDSLFNLPVNRENFQLFYKFLSQPAKGLCLCQSPPAERLKILEFFDDNPLNEHIHVIDMVKPLRDPMELQKTIISMDEKSGAGKNIYFVYNIEECIRLLKKTEKEFFQGINLIRDFFMHFEAAFVFWATEASVKKMIRNAFDFYDWMQFTFTFLPEPKKGYLPSAEPVGKEAKKYSNLHIKINYLEDSLEKVKNEKAKSLRLMELGNLYFQAGDYDSALERFVKSLEIEEKLGDLKNTAMLHYLIGLNHKAKGQLENALSSFYKAAEIFDKYNEHANLKQVRADIDEIHRLKEERKNATEIVKRTGTAENDEFHWDELLERIRRREIIPVIGHGLYRVAVKSKEKSNVLLYDYLAEQVAEACRFTLNPAESHKFAKACNAFLRKSGYSFEPLIELLLNRLKGVNPVPSDSLMKLTRIKAFSIFITTAYDDLLAKIIKAVREMPVEILSYTLYSKYLGEMTQELSHDVKDSKCTVVYHIFGDMRAKIIPAVTEKDMMESLMNFHKDSDTNSFYATFRLLRESSFLYIGCGFDDWLYRIFIHILTNIPFSSYRYPYTVKYVVDDFINSKKDPFQELPRFLRENGIEIFQTRDCNNFVDILFEKLERAYPEELIQPVDFPVQVGFTEEDEKGT